MPPHRKTKFDSNVLINDTEYLVIKSYTGMYTALYGGEEVAKANDKLKLILKLSLIKQKRIKSISGSYGMATIIIKDRKLKNWTIDMVVLSFGLMREGLEDSDISEKLKISKSRVKRYRKWFSDFGMLPGEYCYKTHIKYKRWRKKAARKHVENLLKNGL